jgi:hypothetical protein
LDTGMSATIPPGLQQGLTPVPLQMPQHGMQGMGGGLLAASSQRAATPNRKMPAARIRSA